MNLDAYLKRINYDGPREVSIETLTALQRAHLLSVPFENLDIGMSRPIILGEENHFEKIVTNRRGGFCFEQNGLFSAILRELGFDVRLMRAVVLWGSRHELGHLTLMVELDERWLVDVGFGEAFIEPLRLDSSEVQVQGDKAFRVRHDGTKGLYSQRHRDGDWIDEFNFYFEPRQLADFTEGCLYHQTSPDSGFTQGRICTLATPTGRKTISKMTFIVTENGVREERPIADEAAYHQLLRDEFGIVLE